MIRGMYTAASGMIFENKRQENIAQNIGNIQTPGFKQTYLSAISNEENRVVKSNGQEYVGNLVLGVSIDGGEIQLTQGNLMPSTNKLDFAIQGEGFFTLEGPNGNLYTRDGRFKVSEDGTLVSSEGYPVLVTTPNGAMESVNVTDDIKVSATGSFEANGTTYQLAVSDLQDAALLEKQGNSTFSYGGNVGVLTEGYTVEQNMTESSNVDPTDAMINMISINRALQMNSTVLTTLDQSLQSTVTEIGRV